VAVQSSHDADPRKHRRAVKFLNQQKRLHGGLPSSASCSALGSLVMKSAASRSVISGFRRGNMIGSKNR
jgi:hypothetical protein